ncbi:uncharacterized protein LOC114521326 [Dendronephthya gigantea]|uniref:uncharacterized protein LOC114521326 n=1 Tax=Dendronephthya gigantea TaxID=151771 RepID=UPI00106A4D0E|nr:uncharacterized protein LOC114521326 [Dendronephthya gigantea]
MMKRLILLVLILSLCQGFPSHSEKSNSKDSAEAKSQGRQYVSQAAQQPVQGTTGNQQAYGPSGFDTQNGQQQYGHQQYDQQQYGQQQYGQQPQQTAGQQITPGSANKGHTGVLYSHRPIPDHDKDINPPEDKKGKKHKKKFSKSKKHEDDKKNDDKDDEE